MKNVTFNSVRAKGHDLIELVLDPVSENNRFQMSHAEAGIMSREIQMAIWLSREKAIKNKCKSGIFKNFAGMHQDDICTKVMDMLAYKDDIYRALSELAPAMKASRVDRMLKVLSKLSLEIGELHADMNNMA